MRWRRNCVPTATKERALPMIFLPAIIKAKNNYTVLRISVFGGNICQQERTLNHYIGGLL